MANDTQPDEPVHSDGALLAQQQRLPDPQSSRPTPHIARSRSNGSDNEKTIVIRDRRKPNQFTTDNVIAREWLPILRIGDAFFFYSVYLSMANRETESSWGSLRTQAEYLQCGVDLIIRGNKLLEICELLYIDTGDHRTCNEYYILDPPPLTDELKERIYLRLDEVEEEESSRNWQSWVGQVRKALDKHRSLPSIWSDRRSRKGGRPVKAVRPEKGACEPQSEIPQGEREAEDDGQKGGCDSQPGCLWDTTRVLVSHNQGACESQPEQEQLTRKTNNQREEEELSEVWVRAKCAVLEVAPSVVEVLLEKYPLELIERQLEWLPFRNPRDPAGMLIRAVQDDWDRPGGYDRLRAGEVWARWMGAEPEAVAGAGGDGEAVAASSAQVLVLEDADLPDCVPRSENNTLLPDLVLDARDVWVRVLEELRMQMTRATFDTWLAGSQVDRVEGGAIVVSVRDMYAVEWLGGRWSGPIERTVTGIVGQPVTVRFVATDGSHGAG
jgi:hypothetical protein